MNNKEWAKKNRKHLRIYKRLWRKKNREKIRAYDIQYRKLKVVKA